MPTYEYFCPTNGRKIQVFHGINIRLQTWGEVCETVSESTGNTPHDAPVERLIGGGSFFLKRPGDSWRNRSGGCCGTQGCKD